ncbi:division/cell wall cluster transcriptional repressor MraZ [Microgenomates group bacterium RBG_16_45_19]|nr:MAG: division/cell wall cluster transcriptional repressor MraZ [Microgenomates group bacterium RBG_16_45_19]
MSRTGSPTAFIGRYYHALEQKGRLSIPALFRPAFGPTAVITRGLDGCLFLLPLKVWDQLVQTTSRLPLTQKRARAWVRLLANHASLVSFDRLGRIQLPDYLRETARLRKQVTIVGSLDRLEIWDATRYRDYLRETEAQAETIAESLTEVHES